MVPYHRFALNKGDYKVANHKSSEKRIRQTRKKTLNNKSQISATKSIIKKVRLFIQSQEKDKALEAFKLAQSFLGKMAGRGKIKKNKASRITSRLLAQVSSIN
jgi:small subunit ribosomal protein S20